MKRSLIMVAIVCGLAFVAACVYDQTLNIPLFRTLQQQPEEHNARVTWIEDGDTITVFGDHSQNIRLYLVDAPEKGEPYSRRVTDYLRHRILNEVVQVQDVGRMNHGRLLAFVSFDGELINLALLREGLAYLAIYHPEEEAYRERAKSAVKEAQKNARGIWR